MNLKIRAIGGESFSITTNVPPQLSAFYIPGSNTISASAGFGSFLLQIIELNGFNWLYSIYNIAEDVSFEISLPIPALICKIVLEATIEYKIKTIGSLLLRKSEFNIISCPSLNQQMHLTKTKQYISLDLFYPPEYVQYALKYYPTLLEFGNKLKLSQPAVLLTHAMHADAQLMEILHRLIHLPYSVNIKKFHLDLLKELLFKALQLSAQTVTYNLKFSMQQVEAIEAAKEFIDAHLPNHFSIMQIARRVGLNEQILKVGFKEIFGTGLYTYLQQQVLIIAKKQLEETNKSSKEIAFEAGYKNANNFSAAFKKKFSKTPMEWRKMFR